MLVLTFLFAVAGLIEFHYAAGVGSPEVYASLWNGAGAWVARGAAFHLVAGLALLTAAELAGRRSGIAAWMRAPLSDARARRWRWTLAGILGVTLVYLVGVEIREIERVLARPTDFGAFYRAARAVAAGGDPYAATQGAYFYPPAFAHLVRPLTLFPMGGASVLWFVIKLALLAAAARMVFELLDGTQLSERARVGLVFGMLAVSSRFWASDLQYGNSNIVVLALVVGALHFDRRGRALAAGLCLAGAATIKVAPILVGIHLLARGRWRALAWAGVALIGFNLLPALVGPAAFAESWRAYFHAGVAGKLADDLAQPDNQSLWGFIGRLHGVGPGAQRALWAILSGALVAVAAAASRRASRRGAGAEALAASLYPGVVLAVSPGSWVVHYVGTMLPVAAVLRLVITRAAPRSLHVAAFAIACVVFAMSGWSRWSVRHSIDESWFLGALLLVLASLAAAAWAEGRAGGIESGPPRAKPRGVAR